jgi:chorismate dehydratase
LLIGDSALRASLEKTDMFVYDLGEMWHTWTGYPFVFALWLCRNEVAERLELKTLARQLIDAKNLVPELLDKNEITSTEVDWMGHDRLMSYWRYNISYQLDDLAQAGLMLYFAKCFESDLIPVVPALNFAML